MVFQEGADRRRIFARAAHPQFDGLETAQQHPGGMRIADGADGVAHHADRRSEEHTSELQSLMRISYAVFCLKKKKNRNNDKVCHNNTYHNHEDNMTITKSRYIN